MSHEHEPEGFWQWLWQYRNSPRLAFILRSLAMIASAGMSLVWARLLLGVMGNELYGVYLAFLALVQLGGLGDLGVSGGVGVLLANYLSDEDDRKCQRLMASTRGVYCTLGSVFLVISLCLAPVLPQITHLDATPSSGSLPLLFVVGSIGVVFGLLLSYINNINYVIGNIVWPILPTFLLGQVASLLHWGAASYGFPLWVQYFPYVSTVAISLLLNWYFLKISHPFLWHWRPIRFNIKETVPLAALSVWAFLGAIGHQIYLTTDQLVINAAIGADAIPTYRFNNRLSELFVTLIASATYFAIPGIVQRILSPNRESNQLGQDSVTRLRRIQVAAACASSVGYLFLNDWFMRVWLGPGYLAPATLQLAFGLNQAISLSGNVGITLLGRLDPHGVRVGSITIGVGALINLALSVIMARYGSLVGVATATVVAQAFVSTVMALLTAKRLQQSVIQWVYETLLVPVGICFAASLAIRLLRDGTYLNEGILLIVLGLLVTITFIVIGLRPVELATEFSRLLEILQFRRKRSA